MRHLLIAIVLTIALAGCVDGAAAGGDAPVEGPATPGEPATGWAARPVIMEPFDGTPDSQDPYTIGAVSLDGDLLHLEVSHSGGCGEHTFELVWSGTWRMGLPAQTGVWLAHDAHGDACEAWITRTLAFDLSPLRVHYGAQYGHDGATLVIEVGDTGETVRYPF